MTVKEAKNLVHSFMTAVNDPEVKEACDVAMKALGKRVPLSPVKSTYGAFMVCPECNTPIEYEQECCDKCGQKLYRNKDGVEQ